MRRENAGARRGTWYRTARKHAAAAHAAAPDEHMRSVVVPSGCNAHGGNALNRRGAQLGRETTERGNTRRKRTQKNQKLCSACYSHAARRTQATCSSSTKWMQRTWRKRTRAAERRTSRTGKHRTWRHTENEHEHRKIRSCTVHDNTRDPECTRKTRKRHVRRDD